MRQIHFLHHVPTYFRLCHDRNRLVAVSLARRIHYRSAAASIQAAYDLVGSKDTSKASPNQHIIDILRGIRGSTLSIQEAYATLKLCLTTGYFEGELLRSCLSVVEAGYFSPALVDGWGKDGPHASELKVVPFKNCFDAINGLSIRDKASLVAWQEKLAHIRHKCGPQSEPSQSHVTEEIDPEPRELFTTKKLGKVQDPRPLRVRVRKMPPGKKLCNTMALQLRDAIPDATLVDLGHICTLFSAKLPLSGQLNDDTMELLAKRLNGFNPEELASVIRGVAILCASAATRASETWCYMRASRNVRPSGSHRLYRINRKKLPEPFLEKVASAAEAYGKNDSLTATPVVSLGGDVQPLEQHLHTVQMLARSDVPLSIHLWDTLLLRAEKHMDECCTIDVQTVLRFFEALHYAKYTTQRTIDTAKRLLSSCKHDDTAKAEMFEDHQRAITQMLRFVSTYSLGECAKDVLDMLAEWLLERHRSLPLHIRTDITTSLHAIRLYIPSTLLALIETPDED